MIDRLLQALEVEQIGQECHAAKIREVYQRKAAQHTRCQNCCKGMIGLGTEPVRFHIFAIWDGIIVIYFFVFKQIWNVTVIYFCLG